METVQQLVTKDMTIGDVVKKYPASAKVMLKHGLSCVGCHVNPYESIELGAKGHGMSEEEINTMIGEVNESLVNQSSAPSISEGDEQVFITDLAAKKIAEIFVAQSKQDYGLRIEVVPGGCSGYMYNFMIDKEPTFEDTVIEEKGVKVFIDPESMEMLRGSTIDYIDSLQGAGFKVENPNSGGSCGCGKSFH